MAQAGQGPVVARAVLGGGNGKVAECGVWRRRAEDRKPETGNRNQKRKVRQKVGKTRADRQKST